MKTTTAVNRIPVDIEEFNDYMNSTDDEQKRIDTIGYTVYKKDKNGKTDYSKATDEKVINEPMYKRWEWTADESHEWSRYRNEYNILFEQYNLTGADEKLKLQLEEYIKAVIKYDGQQQLVNRVAISWVAPYYQMELFFIRQDDLEYETPLRTITLKYEMDQPFNATEKTFIKKYLQLHTHSFEMLQRIKKCRKKIEELRNTLPELWEQLPILKDELDKARNSICMPSPHFKGMWSDVVSFTVPTLEQSQQNVEKFNSHMAAYHKELMDLDRKCDIVYPEYEWVLDISNCEDDKATKKLWDEVEDLKSKLFDDLTSSISSCEIDEDWDNFLGEGWSQVSEASNKGTDDWSRFCDEQKLLINVYTALCNYCQNGNTSEDDEDDIETIDINALPKENESDDLRAETIKKYKTDLENNTNTYFDSQDWHIIMDDFASRNDNKNMDIAIERALKQHPDNSSLIGRLAYAETEKHNYQKALELIKQVEQPGAEIHPNILYNKANIYCQLHTPDLAIPIYKKFAAMESKDLTWWRTHSIDRLIDIYEEKKEYDQCIAWSKKAIEERKGEHHLYANMALYYSLSGNNEEAEKLMTEYVAAHPKSDSCWERLGNIYVDMKQYEKAIPCFDTAFNIDKDENYGALNLKGKALMELKRYDEALVCFETCILYYKLGDDFFISAAKCFAALNLPELSTARYRKALSLNPESKEAMDALKIVTGIQN